MDDTTLMKRCPQWEKCSAPDCPLDPEYLQRGRTYPGEEKCGAWKSTRVKIVQATAAEWSAAVKALPYGGLTRKEHAAEARSRRMKADFAALPDEVKEQKRREARERLSGAQKALSADGCNNKPMRTHSHLQNPQDDWRKCPATGFL